jgi:peptidoglycan/xylan/chitin deacetylase (PgdA/CDA1 family)
MAILGYHKIGEPSPGAWETWYYVSESTFLGHLKYLRENGWQVIDVAAFVRGLTEPDSLPERAALITFDDGYRCVLEVALPCLLAFGFPAVHFVPTDFIGGRNWFDAGAEPEEDICGWEDLRQLDQHGVTVQAHSASHRRFSELDLPAQEQELARAKNVLETGLGKPVEIFSFPYGDDGGSSALIAASLKRIGYRAACLYQGGVIRLPITNPYCLPRLAMGPDTDLHAGLV